MGLNVPSTLSVMISVWMEGIFYGINVIVYATCLCIIISRKARGNLKIQTGLLILSTLLFASSTAHMVINVRRLIVGYVISSTKAEMNRYFGDITEPLIVAQEFIIATTYFFSDLIIVRSPCQSLLKIIYSMHRLGESISCGPSTGASRSYR
jgi:hypothetical protein